MPPKSVLPSPRESTFNGHHLATLLERIHGKAMVDRGERSMQDLGEGSAFASDDSLKSNKKTMCARGSRIMISKGVTSVMNNTNKRVALEYNEDAATNVSLIKAVLERCRELYPTTKAIRLWVDNCCILRRSSMSK